MGRSRRRQRQMEEKPKVSSAVERLKAVYRSVQEPWRADVAAPVLPLEGLQPWEEIRGPALALEDQPAAPAPVLESRDPSQLELAASPDELGDLTDDEAGLAAVAELEALTQAAWADARSSARAADLVAEALAATEPEPEPQPDPSEILFAQAQAARPEEARALYRQLLAQFPANLKARNNLALLLDAAGDHAGALAELDRALDLDPDHGTLLVNRGALLGAQGRFAAAERDLKRVLRVEPSHAEALFNLGVVMTKKGLWGEAVPLLRRTIELDPSRAAAHFYLGEALNHVDDLGGAMLAYQRAAELVPGHSRALYGLGIVYDRMGRPDDAAMMYRRSREVTRR